MYMNESLHVREKIPLLIYCHTAIREVSDSNRRPTTHIVERDLVNPRFKPLNQLLNLKITIQAILCFLG